MGRKNQRRAAAGRARPEARFRRGHARQRAPGGDMSIDERDDLREWSEEDAPRRHEAEHEARPPFSDRERGDEESGRPLKLDR